MLQKSLALLLLALTFTIAARADEPAATETDEQIETNIKELEAKREKLQASLDEKRAKKEYEKVATAFKTLDDESLGARTEMIEKMKAKIQGSKEVSNALAERDALLPTIIAIGKEHAKLSVSELIKQKVTANEERFNDLNTLIDTNLRAFEKQTESEMDAAHPDHGKEGFLGYFHYQSPLLLSLISQLNYVTACATAELRDDKAAGFDKQVFPRGLRIEACVELDLKTLQSRKLYAGLENPGYGFSFIGGAGPFDDYSRIEAAKDDARILTTGVSYPLTSMRDIGTLEKYTAARKAVKRKQLRSTDEWAEMEEEKKSGTTLEDDEF